MENYILTRCDSILRQCRQFGINMEDRIYALACKPEWRSSEVQSVDDLSNELKVLLEYNKRIDNDALIVMHNYAQLRRLIENRIESVREEIHKHEPENPNGIVPY